jgi:hypothetical protein
MFPFFKAKLKAVQDYIKDLLTGDKKFVVFCHHKVMLTGIGKPADPPFYLGVDSGSG